MEICTIGVRKGAWTEEEDFRLKQCIEMHGVGKWHQVPLRAGLNRCRKSCRLRWLNYLKPDIKRGKFTMDEVDLILRLHKLLGNRWSLIAGRLPGRTANDVKNYWNTHLRKKGVAGLDRHHDWKLKDPETKLKRTNVIKPRPRTFSKNLLWMTRNPDQNIQQQPPQPETNRMSPSSQCPSQLPPSGVEQKENASWWESLLADIEEEDVERNTAWSLSGSEGPDPAAMRTTSAQWTQGAEGQKKIGKGFAEEGDYWNWDVQMDVDADMDNVLWDLLRADIQV